ncbi:serine hydrolase [Actinokineospora sp. UTMC 2448]|uniref:serine hydrolase domain-containing protein n=1 Tax=Actinokineospora sp. UTMC 2448 TaxID=2268449 RepID=UPI00216405A3|nr:serine hydrolase domain-containing protein [Actinokineospora sp. UTMC 2448]UVS77462.1 D-alanyl-D-alanine carboxypeptidase precursor [Actinokineospora sp. UTMC 2448]
MGIRRLAVLGTAVVMGLTATVTTASADTGGDVDPAVVQAALDRMAKDGVQGVQVRIVDDGETLVLRSGTARLNSQRPVPLDGRFRVGSVTKTFVSTVVLQLVDEGKVGLDEPVTRYLPGLVDDRITVRMMLQHTSGLFNYTNALLRDPESFVRERFRHYSAEQLLEIGTSRPLDFEPGTDWSYSNTNYILAGMLIEEVSGQSWERAVERRILRPLGLRDTRTGGIVPQGPHAHGYMTAWGKPVDVTAMNSSVAGAAGAMISTTADLDRFLDALLSGELLPASLLAQMRTTVDDYGLGLGRSELPCGTVAWGHDGGIPGYVTVTMSTADTSTRMIMSVTSAPTPGAADGLTDVLAEVFCS